MTQRIIMPAIPKKDYSDYPPSSETKAMAQIRKLQDQMHQKLNTITQLMHQIRMIESALRLADSDATMYTLEAQQKEKHEQAEEVMNEVFEMNSRINDIEISYPYLYR